MKGRPKQDVRGRPGMAPLRSHVHRDGTDLARLEYALEEQLRFERFVTDVSARFACLPVENADEEITAAIQGIVEFLGVERGSFGGFLTDNTVLRVSHTYNRPDAPPTPRTVVNDQLPWLSGKLLSGQDVILERIPEDLPPEAVQEREYFTAEGMKAGMALPLKVGGKFAYAISVSSFRSHRAWPAAVVGRLRLLGEMFANTVERRRLEQAVDEQLRFEHLIAEISARFASLQLGNVDAEIVRALEQITQFLGVDQTACLRFSPEDDTLATTHTYNAPGVTAPGPPSVLHTQFPWYTSKVRQGEIVRFESLPDGLPPEAAKEREFVLASGMKAHLSLPIKMGGSVAFLLAAVSFRAPREWPDKVVHRLQLLGEIFSSAIVRKQAQQALRESEAKFRQLAETATCGIGIYQDRRFHYVNPRAAEITGYSVDEFLSMDVEQLVHPDSRALVLDRAQRRLRGEPVPSRYEIKILTRQGEERWVDFAAAETLFQGQPAIIGTAFDVTERRRAQEALHELSGRLIQAQEDERARVARELHDDLSQRLALLSIELEQVRQQVAASIPAQAADLHGLCEQAREIGTDIHRISRQLHPSQLEALGLVAAVRSFCAEFSKQKNVRIEFEHDGVPQDLSPDATLCLFRIVQESLQNTAQHARARRVTVTLAGASEAIRLVVTDDGAGFDPGARTRSAGLGLVSMRERARSVGGDFSVRSQPTQGTAIEVRIPLPSPAAS